MTTGGIKDVHPSASLASNAFYVFAEPAGKTTDVTSAFTPTLLNSNDTDQRRVGME